MRKFLIKSGSWRDQISIFSLFILLSCVVTHPLIFRMRSYLYGLGGDALGFVSRLWRIKYTYLNPSVQPLIVYPYGGVNAVHVVKYILWDSLAIPLTFLADEIFTFNFFLLVSFFLSAVIVYYLVYYFTKSKLASIVAGIIYTLCPYHFAHSGHFNLANIQWMPLYALALFRLDEERSYKSALFCALAFSMVFLSDYYYGYFVTIFTGLFILWRVWYGLRNKRLSGEKKERLLITDHRSPLKTVKVVLVAAVVALAIILPCTRNIFKIALNSSPGESITKGGIARPFEDLFMYSAQVFHYLVPSGDNPFIGSFTRNFIKVYHPTEQTLYLGWVGIVLSLIAIREWRRENKKQARKWESEQVSGQRRLSGDQVIRLSGEKKDRSPITDHRSQRAVSFFVFAGIMALIFSRAPWTDIGLLRIFFPSCFLYKIAPMFRCYARFGILVMLSVSILAGIGLAGILQKIKAPKKRGVLVTIILLLVFIEFAPIFPTPRVNAINPPPVYEWLSEQPGDFAIAEYPLEGDLEYFFWQRVHQKRLVNGAVPGTHADNIRKEIVDILNPKTAGILNYLGAKYVIFHPEKYAKSDEVEIVGEIPDIKKQPELKLIKTFPKAAVYEIMALPIEPEVSKEGPGTIDERRSKRGSGQ